MKPGHLSRDSHGIGCAIPAHTNSALIFSVSPKNGPDLNNEEGKLFSALHTAGRRPVRMRQHDGIHKKYVVHHYLIITLLYSSHGILQTTVSRLLYFYIFISPSHELVLSILDKTSVISLR